MPYVPHRSLMIVAHPDDETIFAGNQLSHHSYFIVCLTNGNNIQRAKEFMAVLEKTNNEGVILSFPDKTNKKRDSWETSEVDIKKTIQNYIKKEDWNTIVTHNPQGEYGHIHHKKTSAWVTQYTIQAQKTNQLYYFALYFKKQQTPTHDKALSTQQVKQKEELYRLYPSQKNTIRKLQHISAYEQLFPYPFKTT